MGLLVSCVRPRSLPVEFINLDLASLQSVRRFVRRFEGRGLPLNVLVNNGEWRRRPHSRASRGARRLQDRSFIIQDEEDEEEERCSSRRRRSRALHEEQFSALVRGQLHAGFMFF